MQPAVHSLQLEANENLNFFIGSLELCLYIFFFLCICEKHVHSKLHYGQHTLMKVPTEPTHTTDAIKLVIKAFHLKTDGSKYSGLAYYRNLSPKSNTICQKYNHFDYRTRWGLISFWKSGEKLRFESQFFNVMLPQNKCIFWVYFKILIFGNPTEPHNCFNIESWLYL